MLKLQMMMRHLCHWIFMFNGVKVYLEKEVQIRLNKDTSKEASASKDDDMFDEEITTKEAQRFEKVWLKMSDKHQFKYYLNADDREEIKNPKDPEK